MERSRLINSLLVLLVLISGLYLAQMIWQMISTYSDVLVLFLLGWLIAFILQPVINALSHRPRVPRTTAVVIIYLLLLVASILFVALFLPPTVVQLSRLADNLPEYADRAPEASAWVQARLARLGVRFNVEAFVDSAINSLQIYAATLIQNALGIFASVIGFVANLIFVLILSFYFAVDEPHLRQRIIGIIPPRYHNQSYYFIASVDRTFGGFVRGQLFLGIMQGIGTAVAMLVLGMDFVLVASLFAGLFMLIPLAGPFLTVLPPLLVALIQAPNVALWILVGLGVYQFVVINVVMPRVLSEAIGMHPLLIIAAILISIKVAGFWGAFFGIPIAGVVWAMLKFFLEEWQKKSAAPA